MIKLYSLDTETKILGLVIKQPNLFSQVRGILSAKDFYSEENRILFSEMLRAKEEGRSLSETGLLDFLENYSIKNREGWTDYMFELIAHAGVETRIDDYIKSLREKTTKRDLELALKSGLTDISSKHKGVEELVSNIESKILDVTKHRELKDFSPISDITSEYSIKLDDIKDNGIQEGIQTGFRNLDNILGGLKNGDLSIVAARPSMGKTAFALEIAKSVSRNNNVGFFSIEMPSEQLVQRMIASEAMLSFHDVRRLHNLPQDQQEAFEVSMQGVKNLKLWVDDSPEGLLSQLTWKARKLHDLVGLDIIIIDYLQLLTTEHRKENRQQQVSDISRALKQLARELKIPVIALSQLSRNVENRKDAKPMMSDIRESGAIEQDADSIMMLYRENYYNNNIQPGSVETLQVIIAKNRNGPTGTAKLNINLSIGKIKDKGGIE